MLADKDKRRFRRYKLSSDIQHMKTLYALISTRMVDIRETASVDDGIHESVFKEAPPKEDQVAIPNSLDGKNISGICNL